MFIEHVVFELADGTSGNEELAHDDNGRVREGQRILVRVSPLKTELGTRATTSAIRLVITTAVLLVALLLCSMILRSARPWWEREEVVDVYRGRLANDFDETT